MDLGFSVMDQGGVDPKYAVGREGWSAINCASKRAYGCGKGGKSAVQDMDLLLHHGDLENLSSSLSVRAGDRVFRWIHKVIAEKKGRDEDIRFRSKVEIVDKGLIVLTLSFSKNGGIHYYLVFDYVDGSLSMVPYIITDSALTCCFTTCPLPLRHQDGGYSLVLIGGRDMDGGNNNFLSRWSPSLDGSSDDPWLTKELSGLPSERDKFFCPDALFSSDGTAFWTDLALGALCCDTSALLGEGYDAVDFTFIELPPGYQADRYDEHTRPVKVYRTMACAGGSLMFASFDRPENPHDGRTARVKVWTLAPSKFEWKLYKDFRLKRSGLPRTLPMYPMFREQEGAGTLYFMLAERDTPSMGYKRYLCRFDLPTKTLLESKLLAHNINGL